MRMSQDESPLEVAARRVVELGNELANQDMEADIWDVADGLLAGAIHYWLYSRQPCGDPMCEECEPVATAEQRMGEMLRLINEMAQDSEYYHSPNDSNVGRA